MLAGTAPDTIWSIRSTAAQRDFKFKPTVIRPKSPRETPTHWPSLQRLKASPSSNAQQLKRIRGRQ